MTVPPALAVPPPEPQQGAPGAEWTNTVNTLPRHGCYTLYTAACDHDRKRANKKRTDNLRRVQILTDPVAFCHPMRGFPNRVISV